MSERNKVIVRRSFEEVYNRGNLAVVDKLISDGFVAHTGAQDIRGAAEMKHYVQQLREAFPDLRIVIEDQVAEGDKVVSRWTATGTHSGSFMGIPPTGKQGSMSGIDIDVVVDGTVVECWSIADTVSLLQQLGALPVSQTAAH